MREKKKDEGLCRRKNKNTLIWLYQRGSENAVTNSPTNSMWVWVCKWGNEKERKQEKGKKKKL